MQLHLSSHRAFCLTKVDEIVNKMFLNLYFELLENLKMLHVTQMAFKIFVESNVYFANKIWRNCWQKKLEDTYAN